MLKVSKHLSILTNEIIEALQVKDGGAYADATFGGGGHTKAILEASAPTGTVMAFDLDPEAEIFAEGIERLTFVQDSYTALDQYYGNFDGIVFDLGFSSDQLEGGNRGFSFQKKDEPLDLRYDSSNGQTAAQFLSQAPLPRIEEVFREYAEDRYWRKLAAQITAGRRANPIRTVGDFIGYVNNESPKVLAPLFQALRIEVNHELENVKHGLLAAKDALKPSGRLAVITFHSLEDRIVKEFFRSGGWELVTKKPITPTATEITQNPRSRSAKLRVATKI